MEQSVLNTSGDQTGKTVSLPDDVFGITPNDHAIYLEIKRYMASQRQGTHKSKERSEIVGSTRKLKKQKGTGTARAGSIKSPIFKGGGRVFGPKPRDYSFKINKKVKRLARRSALTYKLNESNLTVLENFSFTKPQTKEYRQLLEGLKLDNKKTLLVLPEADKNLFLSSRNLPKAKVVVVDLLNTYDILNAEKLLICEGAVAHFSKF